MSPKKMAGQQMPQLPVAPAMQAAAIAALASPRSHRDSARCARSFELGEVGIARGTPSPSASTTASTKASSTTSGKTPTPPPSASTVGSRGASRASRTRATMCGRRTPQGDDLDRCTCCSKDDFWLLFDTFEAMDRQHKGFIGRNDFGWALKFLGTGVEFHRVANKCKLAAHFHNTTQDLSFEDFIRRALPTVTDADLARMRHWANLRRAHRALTSGHLRATETELRRVFCLLQEEPVGDLVSVAEIIRAKICSREELATMLPADWTQSSILGFEEFSALMLEKYWVSEEGQEEDMIRPSDALWRSRMKMKFKSAGMPDKAVESAKSMLWRQDAAVAPVPERPPADAPHNPQRWRRVRRAVPLLGKVRSLGSDSAADGDAGGAGGEMEKQCAE